MRRLHLIGILLVATISCASPQPAAQSLVLEISNELGRTIAEIHTKSCDDLDLAFSPIDDSHFASGETRGLVLPPTCVDLVAYDSRGRIVGEQRGLKMRPDARWVLRR